MTKLLSEKCFRLSDEMATLSIELDGKYHVNAVELAGAAMIMKDWAAEIEKIEREAVEYDK